MTEDKKFKRLVRARSARTGESYSTSLQHLRARKTEEQPLTETKTPEEWAAFSCSFCGKSQKDVKKLIAGPEVFICDECVVLCTDIISEDAAEAPPTEDQLGAAWAAILKNRARAAKTAESALESLVRQARAKGVAWSSIADFIGGTPEEAEERFGRQPEGSD